MKTAVIGEDESGVITYNAALVALLNHYGANLRVHATTRRMVNEAFAEERPSLKPLPAIAYNAVLTVEGRVSKDGMVSVGGNLYSVSDTTGAGCSRSSITPPSCGSSRTGS